MATAASGSGKLVKHSTIYAVGTLSRQLVGFLLLPLYTHYMTPADYGMVGLLVFSLALLEPLLGARLCEAIPRFYFEQNTEAGRGTVITTAMAITAGISSVASLLIFALKAPASRILFGTTDYSWAVGLFGVQLVTQALEYYGLTFIRILQRPVVYITVSLSKMVVQLTLNIVFIVFLHWGAMGIIASGTISSALYALAMIAYVLRQCGWRFDRTLAKSMLRFNLPLWFSGLAALYIFSSNRYYIRVFSSLDQVGLYELAARLAGALSLLIWTPFSQFWEMERFRVYKTPASHHLFASVFRFASTLLLIAGLGISIFAEPVVKIMSAPEFHGAAAAVPFLVVAGLFASLANFCGFSFLITNQTRIINRNSYVTALLITVLNVALIPFLGQIGAALALMISLAAQFFIIYGQGRSHFDMRISLPPFFVMLAVAVAGFAIASVAAAQVADIAGILIRLVVYALCCVAFLAMLWRDPASKAQLLAFGAPLLHKLKREAR
jgi:O-antigen/teichoic acid export membrane protein